MKVGLEIHQQLDTHKLFCSCPSLIRNDEPHGRIVRNLRAIAGELGDVDIAAQYEQMKGKDIIYEFYEDTNCLVELDEEPPHPLNKEALKIGLQVALLLNMEPVEEIHVMRKTVIDGSNPSGFQRTALIARNGYINTSKGKVRISSLCLEEDAARKISESEGKVVYRVDRLGIPLLEIRTEPDIKDPEHAKETAKLIGMVLRVCKVKRGIGTIRQDVNVSIPGGNRVEIKGAQDLRHLHLLVEKEGRRQEHILKISRELRKRGIKRVRGEVKKVSVKLFGRETFGVKLEGFKGLIGGGEFRIGKDFSAMAKNLGYQGVVHCDELPNYGLGKEEVKRIREELNCEDKDGFALIAADERGARKVLKEIVKRANQYIKGVPRDVRKANPDGTTSYLRPMPGEARMYPETDLEPVVISKEFLEEVKRNLPEHPKKILKRYEEWGIHRGVGEKLILSGKFKRFEKLVEKYEVRPTIVADLLLSLEHLLKKFELELKDEWLEKALKAIEEGKITKNLVPEFIYAISKGKEEEFLEELSQDLGEVIEEVLRENQELVSQGRIEKLVGLVLRKVRANPKVVYEIIKGRIKRS